MPKGIAGKSIRKAMRDVRSPHSFMKGSVSSSLQYEREAIFNHVFPDRTYDQNLKKITNKQKKEAVARANTYIKENICRYHKNIDLKLHGIETMPKEDKIKKFVEVIRFLTQELDLLKAIEVSDLNAIYVNTVYEHILMKRKNVLLLMEINGIDKNSMIRRVATTKD